MIIKILTIIAIIVLIGFSLTLSTILFNLWKNENNE